MENYVITTDNTADLPYSYYKEHQVEYMYLTYQLEAVTYNKENELDVKEFYNRMRAGSMPMTSQVNSEEAKDVLRPILEAGNNVLHLAFSSGLSGSYNSVRLAAEELKEEYPDRKIHRSGFAVCISWGRSVCLQGSTDERSGNVHGGSGCMAGRTQTELLPCIYRR